LLIKKQPWGSCILALPFDYLERLNRKSGDEIRSELIDEHNKTKGFVDQMRHEFNDLWNRIDRHPFLVEIEQGKLPIEKYRAYAIQNNFYIVEHFRCMGAAISHAQPSYYATIFARLLQLVPPFGSEEFAFPKIAKAGGVTEADFARSVTDPSIVLPGSQAYVDFMYKMFSVGSPGLAVSSFIVCPWSYTERVFGGIDCAKRVAIGLGKIGVDPEVVKAYTLEEGFSEWHMRYLRIVKDIVNDEAEINPESKHAMRDAYRRNCEFEYTFWDQAYKYTARTEVPLEIRR
jgi:thiaminase (transcriptional activator TenA)